MNCSLVVHAPLTPERKDRASHGDGDHHPHPQPLHRRAMAPPHLQPSHPRHQPCHRADHRFLLFFFVFFLFGGVGGYIRGYIFISFEDDEVRGEQGTYRPRTPAMWSSPSPPPAGHLPRTAAVTGLALPGLTALVSSALLLPRSVLVLAMLCLRICLSASMFVRKEYLCSWSKTC